MSREGDYGNRMAQSSKSAEDVARMVFSFVSGAGELVNDLDKGDEVKLLRLRTRKNEMVIVPGEYAGVLQREDMAIAHVWLRRKTLLTLVAQIRSSYS